jgi:arylsulfatase A-like enzyme
MSVGRGRRAIFAGFWGGLLAGALDAGFTLVGAWNVLPTWSVVHLAIIDAGLGAVAGSALAVMFIGWSLGLEQLLGRSRWLSGTHAVALLLAAPLMIYDAFALFSGVRAARIPGHHILSIGLVMAGVVAVWAGVTLWGWLLSRAEPGAREGGGGRLTLVVIGLAVVGATLAVGWANFHVLPRLYHWFHLSLALLDLVLCILAVRLLLGAGQYLLGTRRAWLLGIVTSAVLLTGAGIERQVFAHSQGLRFYVYEKTQLASLFARLLHARQGAAVTTTVATAVEPAPSLPEGPRRREADVVLITIDAVRADHLGCFGYGRATTPNIDALAARAVRFERAYTQAPHTSFALASLMIGKYYPTLARLAASDSHETLAAILRRYGWKTAAFFPPAVFYIDAHKMKAFESTNFDFEYVKYEYLSAEGRVRQIDDFLQAERPQKLFLWLHLFEPHEPYEKHAGFDLGNRDVDRYDSEIAYADGVVGKVLALLQAKRPNAIVILAADHGEEFGEHGGRYHGTTLFEEQVHVPLLVAVPGLAPRVVVAPVELIDVPATLFGLLDIPLPLRMRGTDLGPWLVAGGAAESRLPPAFAEVEDKRMIALGKEKLICDAGKDYCNYFDLAADPAERNDLADQRAERVAALRQRLDAWLGDQARFESRLVGAAGGEGAWARAIERGRLGDASVALPLAQVLRGEAPVAARREAASLLVTALPPRAETKALLDEAAARADDEEVRCWAAVAAFRAGSIDQKARLHTIVQIRSTETATALQTHAALALADQGDGSGLPALTAALTGCAGLQARPGRARPAAGAGGGGGPDRASTVRPDPPRDGLGAGRDCGFVSARAAHRVPERGRVRLRARRRRRGARPPRWGACRASPAGGGSARAR